MAEITKYYDSHKSRLVYVGTRSDETFWDNTWSSYGTEKLLNFREDPFTIFIIKKVEKYLNAGSRVLEGGCGCGDKVYALHSTGYDAYGIDYAKETIMKIKETVPDLKITHGDLRRLNFEDSFFDGYLSLGVIEHYYYGYGDIVKEIYRVLKRGGILFMTVPTMSLIRKFKATIGKYPQYAENEEMIKGFYQFALDPDEVLRNFQDKGFELLRLRNIDGFYGLNVEIDFFKPLFQFLHKKKTLPRGVLIRMFEYFGDIFANHLTFYIMRKE
jgi:SAM-dependent methyltransferase